MIENLKILKRTDRGSPFSGTFDLQGSIGYQHQSGLSWERDDLSVLGLKIHHEGQPVSPLIDEYSLKDFLKRLINRQEATRYRSEARKRKHTDNWPLHNIPEMGVVTLYGWERRASYTLDPDEYAFAMDLRHAAMQGDTFSEMISSIEDRGFSIRPAISQNKKTMQFKLQGFRFSRDEIEMPASSAFIHINENPETKRAPVLSRDGSWLMEMKTRYDTVRAPIKAGIDNLFDEVRCISEEFIGNKEIARKMHASGIAVTRKQDTLNHSGEEYDRTRYYLMKGDVTLHPRDIYPLRINAACRQLFKLCEADDLQNSDYPEP